MRHFVLSLLFIAFSLTYSYGQELGYTDLNCVEQSYSDPTENMTMSLIGYSCQTEVANTPEPAETQEDNSQPRPSKKTRKAIYYPSGEPLWIGGHAYAFGHWVTKTGKRTVQVTIHSRSSISALSWLRIMKTLAINPGAYTKGIVRDASKYDVQVKKVGYISDNIIQGEFMVRRLRK